MSQTIENLQTPAVSQEIRVYPVTPEKKHRGRPKKPVTEEEKVAAEAAKAIKEAEKTKKETEKAAKEAEKAKKEAEKAAKEAEKAKKEAEKDVNKKPRGRPKSLDGPKKTDTSPAVPSTVPSHNAEDIAQIAHLQDDRLCQQPRPPAIADLAADENELASLRQQIASLQAENKRLNDLLTSVRSLVQTV